MIRQDEVYRVVRSLRIMPDQEMRWTLVCKCVVSEAGTAEMGVVYEAGAKMAPEGPARKRLQDMAELNRLPRAELMKMLDSVDG